MLRLTSKLRVVAQPRRLSLLLAVFAIVALLIAAPPAESSGPTNVSGTISANTTWTVANSPYVLTGNVTVAAGVTLTVEPGVVVKFNGQSRMLIVNGTLNAIGTSASHIVFTSYQDDTAGGDTNGDGTATSGAPGQWHHISFESAGSQLAYTDVRYGGFGSAQNYAPIKLWGSGAAVSIDHAAITNNHKTAVAVGDRATVTITNSTLSNNVYGLYVNAATAIVDQTTIAGNTSRGIWFNLPTLNPLPAASRITNSDITSNTGYGVFVGANGDYPLASMPTGTGSNIYANNANGVQLTTSGFPSWKNADVNWRDNYWGDDVYYSYNGSACGSTSPHSTGHLAYRSDTGGAGPISSGSYSGGGSVVCTYDRFKVGPCEFSPTKLDGGVYEPFCQTLGSIHGTDATEELADPVNSATGSFTHSETDLSLPGIGVPFTFTRYYNSIDLTAGSLGQGWTHSLAASLTVEANGDVTVRGEDGQQVDYTKQSDGSFVGARGSLSTLAAVAHGYDLTRTDQVKYHFTSEGRLTSMVDRNGKGLALAYGGDGKLATVTDGAGRVATFTHDAGGLLTKIAIPSVGSVSYGYTNGRLTSFTDLRGKIWTYAYESHGFLASETDPLGHRQFLNTYGDDGRVTQQLDALNNATNFSWNQSTQTTTATDARGNVWKDAYAGNVLQKRIDALGNATEFGHNASLDTTSVKGPSGEQTTMTYDARGNLLSATVPPSLGSVQKTFTYDAANNATSVTDARGQVTTYAYDAAGNNTTVVQDGQTVATYAYNTSGQLISSTDGRNNTTTYTYDANGNLSTETDPLGNKTTYTYDAAGRMTSKVEPRGNVQGANPNEYRWTYSYDAAGRLLTETDPLGNVTTHAYDAAGNETSVTDANNKTTTYAYDAADRLASQTAPDAGVTSYTYDAVGNKLTEKDPNDRVTTYAYDADNRLASITTPLGNKTTFVYDASGNLTKEVEPRGNVQGANPNDYATTYTYDAAGRMLTETTPLGHTTTYVYDAVGNRTSFADPNGHTSTFTYDGLNRLSSVTAPGGAATTYAYDAAGNLASRTDPNSHTTNYAYDAANRRTSETQPLGRVWTYSYDAAGNRVSMVDANGNATPAPDDGRTAYSYDRASRLTGIDYSDSTPDVAFVYDGVGNRTQMTDGFGAQAYTYDAVNRLKQVTRGADTFSYNYDSAGNLTRRTYPDGAIVDYTYDADSRLASVASGGQTTSYGYDAAGNLTTTTLPGSNGHVDTRTYNRAGRLVAIKNAKGEEILSEFTYTLDPVGNPTQVVRTGSAAGTTTFSYDVRDRLTEVCFQTACPGGSDPFIRWTYDAVGNRLTEARPSGTTTYTYNAGDQLTQGGSTAYAYDQNGNQTQAGSRTFSYDLANRLVSTSSGGTTTTYSYDGDGNRAQAASASQLTRYVWDTAHSLPQLAIERDGSGQMLRRYLYGHKRVGVTTTGGTFYYHYDRLGSVTNLTSPNGSRQWTYSYEPFGDMRTQTQDDPLAPPDAMKFAAELLDETGLYYLRARQYDAVLGRFLQLDPVSPSEAEPQISPYVYAGNRPSVFIDPSGRAFEPPDDHLGWCESITSAERSLSAASDASQANSLPECPRSYYEASVGSFAKLFKIEMRVKESDPEAIQYFFEYRYKKAFRLDAKQTEASAYGRDEDNKYRRLAYNSSVDRRSRRPSQIKPWYAHFSFRVKRNTVLTIKARTEFVAPISFGSHQWVGDRYTLRCRVPKARK